MAEDIDTISDIALFNELKRYGFSAPPVNDATRKILKKKLLDLRSKAGQNLVTNSSEDEHPGGGDTLKKKGRRLTKTPKKEVSPKAFKEPTVIKKPAARLSTTSRSPRKELKPAAPYETGSDTDDNTTTPSRNKSSPFQSIGLFSSSSIKNDELKKRTPMISTIAPATPTLPSSPFQSQFGQRLFSQTSTPLTPSARTDISNIATRGSNYTPAASTSSFYRSTFTPSAYKSPNKFAPPNNAVTAPPTVTETNSMSYVSLFLLLSLGIFFTYLAVCYISMKSSSDQDSFELNPENRFSFCRDRPGQMSGVNCVTPADAKHAMNAARILVPYLQLQAKKYHCENSQKYLTEDDVKNILLNQGLPDAESIVPNLRVMALDNKHWGIAVVEKGFEISESSAPLSCIFLNFIYSFFDIFVVLLIVCLVLFATYFVLTKYRNKQKTFEAHKNILKERLLDSLEFHSNLQSSVPLYIIKEDILKTRDPCPFDKTLDAAINELVHKDNKIFIETTFTNGQELRALSLNSDIGRSDDSRMQLKPRVGNNLNNSTASTTTSNTNSQSTSAQAAETNNRRRFVWQGQAFENNEPSNSGPSPCLKIKNMFEPDLLSKEEDKTEMTKRISDAVLEKCGESVNVVHIVIDELGYVYMKCASVQDSGRAHRALHGAWYDGNLVTCKYMSIKRYHEKFETSINCCIPLKPSNNLKASLPALA